MTYHINDDALREVGDETPTPDDWFRDECGDAERLWKE